MNRLRPAWKSALTAACALALMQGLRAEALTVRVDGDDLHVSAPDLDLIHGQAQEQLKNGASVAFDIHLAVWVGSRTGLPDQRAFDRFIVSYDLWEEKYSVAGVRNSRMTASHLTAKAVPAWCLAQMVLSAVGLRRDAPIWVRLEVVMVDRKSSTWSDDPEFSLKGLIALLSGSNRKEPNHWSLEAGPLRLADLVQPPRAGERP